MRPLRNGDLTLAADAAELIDSAQGCARLMAECCAAKDAEIERLQEQVRYEQQRNEENVALNDYEMKQLREAIRQMELRLRAVYNNDWYAIGEEELDEWRRIGGEGR